MPNFNSLSDLAKYIGSPIGQKTVFGQKDTRKALNEAATLLEKIMYEELQAYYASYTPVDGGYERTYGLLNSLRISPITQVGNELRINVYFDRDSATHPSIFGGESGYVAQLIDQGWKWNNDIGIDHLSHYSGFGYVQKSIYKFNSVNRWGFRISKNSVKKH